MKLTESHKEQVLKELRTVPGVGKSVAQDLWNLGIRSVGDLQGRSPEKLYEQLCDQMGVVVDRCMLYTFRCAVYYATEKKHKPELLLWWNWMDNKMPKAKRKS